MKTQTFSQGKPEAAGQLARKRKTFLPGWLLLAVPVAVQAQFNYTVTNQTVTITGYTGTSSVVDIPGTINGLQVTCIGDDAFYSSIITDVTIPNSVTTIGINAFAFCWDLTSITIPNSVTSVGDHAFDSCSSLPSVTIPDSVITVGDFAFYACPSLTNITFGSGVTSIGNEAFSDCGLTSVTIPNSVISIGDGAFVGCYSLTNITFGTGVTSIGDGAFTTHAWHHPGCPLMNITIPNSVTNIGGGAFEFCSSLTNVTIGNSVISIGAGAFAFSGLTSIIIPNSVTRIGNATMFSNGAFTGCSSLSNITVDSLNSTYSSVDGVLFNYDRTALVQYPGGKVGSYTIPNSVTSIGYAAAFVNWGLTRVTIPNSVTNIGDYAFCQCSSLTRVYFQGNAPGLGGIDVFANDYLTIYYLPGTTGWGSTIDGVTTALWTLPYPLILNGSVGAQSNQFGFTVSWATNLSVVVEASADLANPTWSPVQTNTLAGGSFYFSDPQWTKYPYRFYRLRSQ